MELGLRMVEILMAPSGMEEGAVAQEEIIVIIMQEEQGVGRQVIPARAGEGQELMLIRVDPMVPVEVVEVVLQIHQIVGEEEVSAFMEKELLG